MNSPDTVDGSLNRTGLNPTGKSDGRVSLRFLLKISIAVLLLFLLLRTFVLTPYAIPTDSMYPTIMEGDALLVNTLPYYIRTPKRIPFTNIQIPSLELAGLGSLERGDIVVFDATEERRSYRGATELVKRCVALPGDRVQLVDGLLSVNGEEPVIPTANQAIDLGRAFPLLQRNRQVTVPYKGYQIPLDSISGEAWRDVIESEGVEIAYRNNIVFLNGRPATFYEFQQDYFFAIGDNSGDSYDSRYFGFVPHENLIGRAFLVYWSRHPDDGIQWGRIGTWLK